MSLVDTIKEIKDGVYQQGFNDGTKEALEGVCEVISKVEKKINHEDVWSELAAQAAGYQLIKEMMEKKFNGK